MTGIQAEQESTEALMRHVTPARRRADYFTERSRANAGAFKKQWMAREQYSSCLFRQVLKSYADILLALDDLDQRWKRAHSRRRSKG